jgi:hypothetical protein
LSPGKVVRVPFSSPFSVRKMFMLIQYERAAVQQMRVV